MNPSSGTTNKNLGFVPSGNAPTRSLQSCAQKNEFPAVLRSHRIAVARVVENRRPKAAVSRGQNNLSVRAMAPATAGTSMGARRTGGAAPVVAATT